jgi:hypothetical protein
MTESLHHQPEQPFMDVSTGMWLVRTGYNPPTFQQFRSLAAAERWVREHATSDEQEQT